MSESAPIAPAQSRRPKALLVLLAAFAVGAAGFGYWQHAQRLPKRFAEVVPGRLYRSGEVSADQLRTLRDEFGVRRVISLLNPEAPESRAEQAACAELGIRYENVPLRGNGASTPADRIEIRRLLEIPETEPTLVHCAAGTNRTGLAIGLYRIYEQGWELARVMEELHSFDFEDEPKHENLRAALRAAAAEAANRRPSP